MGLLRKIRDTGRVAEPAPPRPEGDVLPQAREFGGSVQVRCVDAGSCNGCEIEIAAAFNPVYDAERYGARLVASPRHADVALRGVRGRLRRRGRRSRRRTGGSSGARVPAWAGRDRRGAEESDRRVSLIPAALATTTALGVAGAPAGPVLPLRVRGASVLPVVQHLPAEIVLVDDLVVLQAFVTRLDRMQGVLLATLQPVEVVDNPAGAGRDSQAW